MKYLLPKIALFMACIVGSLHTAALADQGGLTLPNVADGSVRLVLTDGANLTDPSAHLQMFVGPTDRCCEGKSAMAGRYEIHGRVVTFEPAFGLVEGQDYTVQTQQFGADGQIASTLTALRIEPQSPQVPPEVIAIYPSGPEIPENTLRFYIHFSTPMSPHLSTQFIQLVNENGVADTAAFMTFKQELWNEDRTRLTLLMDPGRIKRGVAQNLELGPALLEGNSYSIVVAPGWQSAQGDQDAPGFEQAFLVSPALRTLPDVAQWDVQPTRRSTLDPIVIELDRPFDVSLAQSGITVQDEGGDTISGTAFIENNQRTWRFEPETAWQGELIRIVVDARLEDVAGNNFRELLDHSVDTDVLGMDQTSFILELDPAPL